MKNTDHTQNIAFVILAAGESNRMGSIKQLLSWQNKSFIDHIIDKGIESLATDTFVVLGANAEKIANSIQDKPVQTIYNPNWKTGMGSTISEAMKYILNLQKDYSGILFSLVDQPLISTSHYNSLISNFISGDAGIVATLCENDSGVPAIFSSSYFEDLIQLKGPRGAKNIIHSNRNDASSIPYSDSNIDIDTPEDYKNFLKDH